MNHPYFHGSYMFIPSIYGEFGDGLLFAFICHTFLPSFYLVFPPGAWSMVAPPDEGLRKQILAAAFQQGPAIQIPLKEEHRLTSEPVVQTARFFGFDESKPTFGTLGTPKWNSALKV